MLITKDINENMKLIEEAFFDCGDFVHRKIQIGGGGKFAYIAYLDMMTDSKHIDINVITKIMSGIMFFEQNKKMVEPANNKSLYEIIKDDWLTTADLQEVYSIPELTGAILSGDTVLLVDGYNQGIVLSSKGFPNRGVPATETEVVVQGAKDAFSEVFRVNTMLIRRRIKDTNLKAKQIEIGRKSKTSVALMYLDDVVRKSILKEAVYRLQNIDIDGIIDAGYIEQFIEDDWMSPFPQVQVTERPDKAAAAILEGRIVIVVDNSPFVLIIPSTLNVYFQTPEDYSQRFEIMSLLRVLRFIAGFIAIAAPGLYLATAVYHPSMIPMMLALKMAGARLNVPFPAVIEILIMEFAFELIREAGTRLPGAIGSTIGIVGGIIVGQAAVDAGIVSPIVVIIVALTGIAGFAVPHYSLVSGFRIMKLLVIAFSAFLGLFGFWIAAIIILIHLVSLKSFGIPYLFPYASGDVNGYTDVKDSLFRLPLFTFKKRPIFANPENQIRMSPRRSGNRKKKE